MPRTIFTGGTGEEAKKKLIPPYLPYKTFATFLDSMKIALPARIDRSLMRSMSGAMQAQLITALEYLQLITPNNGVPTEKLNRLVHSEGADRQKILKEVLTSSYPFLFKDGFDLQRVTSHQLQECFSQTGTTGDTMRKCIAFFMKAAKDAGIVLSPHIKKVTGRPRGSITKNKRIPSTPQHKQSGDSGTADFSPPGDDISLEKLLLSKFPSFDPAWPDDVKAKWFDGFKELMTQFKRQSENE